MVLSLQFLILLLILTLLSWTFTIRVFELLWKTRTNCLCYAYQAQLRLSFWPSKFFLFAKENLFKHHTLQRVHNTVFFLQFYNDIHDSASVKESTTPSPGHISHHQCSLFNFHTLLPTFFHACFYSRCFSSLCLIISYI